MGKGSGGSCERSAVAFFAGDPDKIMNAHTAEADDQVYTDPELLEQLTEEQRAALEAKVWKQPGNTDPFFSEVMARELGIDFVTALRLDKEHLSGTDYRQHELYLRPTRELLRSPEETVDGMQAAAQMLSETIDAGEKIAVFADYDVDGTTSARVLDMALEQAGAGEDQVIREYASGSFGLTKTFVQDAVDQGASVLVTLDCGSSQTDAIAYAQSQGMRVIVVDHHEVELDNPADFHLNPRLARGVLERDGKQAVEDASKLLKEAVKAKEAWLADRDDPQLTEQLEELKVRAQAMVEQLDALSGAEQPSGKLNLAIERVKVKVGALADDPNTGAQLSWKFGQALLEAKHGETPESWYEQPMYLAGLGALADMAPMGTQRKRGTVDLTPPEWILENRAFVRLPVAEGASPAPAAVRLLAEHFGEDPDDPAGLVRTRATLNLPKRMPSVEAASVVAALAAPDRKTARPKVKKLLAIYEDATEKKNEMKDLGAADWESRRREDSLVGFAVIDDPKYAPYSGQSGTLSNAYMREQRMMFTTFVAREQELPDDDGVPRRLVKWSARNPTSASIKGLDKDEKMLEACMVPAEQEDGSVIMKPSVGGHAHLGVVSGSCTVENIEKVQEVIERWAKDQDRRSPGCWTMRQSNAVWTTKRMVPAERLARLEEEAKLIAPVAQRNYPTRISVAARVKNIGEYDEVKKTHPATMVLADGSTRECDVKPEAVPAFSTGAWFETAISLGSGRYWLRDIRPIDKP